MMVANGPARKLGVTKSNEWHVPSGRSPVNEKNMQPTSMRDFSLILSIYISISDKTGCEYLFGCLL